MYTRSPIGWTMRWRFQVMVVMLQLQATRSGWVKVWQEVDSKAVVDVGVDQTNAMFDAGGGVLRYDIKDEPFAYFRRLTAPDEFDAHSVFTECWTTAHHGVLNTDFELFGTEGELWGGVKQWKYCNADDCNPGMEVGAFRVRMNFRILSWSAVRVCTCCSPHVPVREHPAGWPTMDDRPFPVHLLAGLWA
jgi:hypothetical protein